MLVNKEYFLYKRLIAGISFFDKNPTQYSAVIMSPADKYVSCV